MNIIFSSNQKTNTGIQEMTNAFKEQVGIINEHLNIINEISNIVNGLSSEISAGNLKVENVTQGFNFIQEKSQIVNDEKNNIMMRG